MKSWQYITTLQYWPVLADQIFSNLSSSLLSPEQWPACEEETEQKQLLDERVKVCEGLLVIYLLKFAFSPAGFHTGLRSGDNDRDHWKHLGPPHCGLVINQSFYHTAPDVQIFILLTLDPLCHKDT